MRRAVALAGLVLLAACAPKPDGFGGYGESYYEPAPTYYSPPPTYYSPPPTYYVPPPVVVRPPPVIVVRPPPRPQPRHCWWDNGRPPRQHCR